MKSWGRLCVVGLCAGIFSVLTGCASVTHGTTQSVKIHTVAADGKTPVEGADCRLSNDKGEARVLSGQTVQVRRSGGNLAIQCAHPDHEPATGQAVSHVNVGLVGNVLIGGVIGVAIDAGTGAGFNYPDWLRLVFGEHRLYDRIAANSGGPAEGTRVGSAVQVVSNMPPSPTVPVSVAAQVSPAPGVAPKIETPATAAAPLKMTDPLRPGDALEYALTDRFTGRSSRVVYQLDRIVNGELIFNSGGRIERSDGEIVSISAPIGGVFDTSTPPGGWMRKNPAPGMSWAANYMSTGSSKLRHDIEARVVGEETLRIDDTPFKVTQIAYKGWIFGTTTGATGAPPTGVEFKATAWYSADLGRVVRFDSNYQQGLLMANESIQLVRVLR
jgi:hypothetical protein